MDPDISRTAPQRLELDLVGSTNDVALHLADGGAAEHTLVTARQQATARGGNGPWHAPVGGLWLSTIWHPGIDACSAGLVTMAAAWGVREGVRRNTGVAPGLKWPNDLILDERKLGGVLVEGRVQGHDVVTAAIGIGVNVNNPPAELPGALAARATSLQMATGRDHDLASLLDDIVVGLKDARRRLARPEELVAAFNTCWTQKGREVTIDTGHTLVDGVAERIGADGALVLSRGGVEHRIDDPTLAKFVRVV